MLLITESINELISNVNNGVKKRQRKASSSAPVLQENMDHEGTKKIMHRDIERQRTQEMSASPVRFNSLPSSSRIYQGKAICTRRRGPGGELRKHMQKKIEEMKMRRDKLKRRLSNSSSSPANTYAEDQNSDMMMMMSCSSDCVNVNGFQGGVEILISSSSLNHEDFPLSKAIAHLLGRGLNVISCMCFCHCQRRVPP